MKKGFTLIELLAVIVILAIIAVIAVPIVLNIIDDSKKNAALRTADFYLDSVEYAIANRTANNKAVAAGEYKIMKNGNVCLEYKDAQCIDELVVDMNGEKPTSGTVIIEKGQIVGNSSNDTEKKTTMTIGTNTIVYNTTEKEYVLEGTEVKEEEKEEVKIVCKPATEKPVTHAWRGDDDPGKESSYDTVEVGYLVNEVQNKYSYGVIYSCDPGDGVERTFFVLEDGDNTTLTKSDFSTTHYANATLGTTGANEVSLIMSDNIGSSAWCDSPSATCNAITAKTTLQSLTSSWTVAVNLPTHAQIKMASGGNTSGLASWFMSE